MDRPRRSVVWLALCMVTACDRDDGDSSSSASSGSTGGSTSGSSTGGFWAVGGTGAMVRMGPSGEATRYPNVAEVDLWAIACRGAREAWVVGEQGRLLSTVDGGISWHEVDSGTSADLFAVAVAEDVGDVVVGGDGIFGVLAPAGGVVPVATGSVGAVHGVAVTSDGTSALAVTGAGVVFRVDLSDGKMEMEILDEVGVPLYAVAGSHVRDGSFVAVGAVGTALATQDRGDTFEWIDLPVTADLYGVATVGERGAFVAVGADGVVVRYDGATALHVDTLEPGFVLRGVHVRADGIGQVVGHDGWVYVTRDGGRSFAAHRVAGGLPLEGVDDFAGPHG